MLKRVVQLYHDKGWKPVVAPEMEFFLVALNVDPAQGIKPMMGRSGRPAAARQAYSMTAVDEFGPVIDDIYDFAEHQGFKMTASHRKAVPDSWNSTCTTATRSNWLTRYSISNA